MITPRENYIIAIHGGKPQWIPDFWEDTNMLPFNKYELKPIEDGLTQDFFGITYMGNMPVHSRRPWKEISDWRKYTFPDLTEIDWEAEEKYYKEIIDPTKLIRCDVGGHGLLLTLANALGFEDALVSLIEEDDEVLAFLRAYTDYMKECIHYAAKYIKPDEISICEDTSNARGPFLSKETYRKLFRPFMQELCDLAHSYNMAFNIHNCGDPQYLFEEYVEMGVNVVNACNYSKSLIEFRKKYGPVLCIEGGWDSQGPCAMHDAPEELVKQSVRDCYDRYAAIGGYVTLGNGIVVGPDPKAMKQKVTWCQEEANRIRFEYYGKKSPEELEMLSNYTNGVDFIWKIMMIE
ncbi:MAG TPA: uroporphyrinogen decarboxylase family protein [Anaerovoracaceae bacterium]|nr:uroporphyrinogen decarboxylase family protein [Anaerovoracaceae bacterium]